MSLLTSTFKVRFDLRLIESLLKDRDMLGCIGLCGLKFSCQFRLTGFYLLSGVNFRSELSVLSSFWREADKRGLPCSHKSRIEIFFVVIVFWRFVELCRIESSCNDWMALDS